MSRISAALAIALPPTLALLIASTTTTATAQSSGVSKTKTKTAVAKPDAKADAGGNQDYALDLSQERRVKAELTLWLEAPQMTTKEWVVYAPALPTLAGQTGVSTALDPAGQPARELSAGRRPIVRAKVQAETPDRKKGLEVRVDYQATLWSRHLVPAAKDRPAPAPPPLSADDRRSALASGGFFDFNVPAFQQWLRGQGLRRGPKEGEVDFARRAFLAIKRNFKFFYDPYIDMKRQASRVCRAGESDVGGLSVLFVSTLRASHIPARVLVGRWAQSGTLVAGKANDQMHAESEFYAQGVGWVPADVASAIVNDESPEGLTFFGNDPGDFLAFHVDPNMICDTIHFGRKTVPWFQRPALWAVGAGDFKPGLTKERWKVETSPAPAPELIEATMKKPDPFDDMPEGGKAATPSAK